jgi:hypothetical protein
MRSPDTITWVKKEDGDPSSPETAEDRSVVDASVSADLAEEFLTGAVAAALAEGASWSHIGERLGVPRPHPADGVSPSDEDWQNAIADRENARATRRHPSQPGTQEPEPPAEAER